METSSIRMLLYIAHAALPPLPTWKDATDTCVNN